MSRFAQLLPVIIALAAPTAAMADFTFSYQSAPSQGFTSVLAGSTIDAASTQVGASSTISFLFQNTTSYSALVSNLSVTGSSYSGSLANSATSVTIASGAQYTLTITFSPVAAGTQSGSLAFTLASAADQVPVPYTFPLFGNGLAPQFLTSYIIAPNGNQVLLHNGDTLSFPTTAVNSTSIANITILNQGNGAGQVNTPVLTGNGFQITALPLTPASVDPAKTLTFNLVFAPLARGTFTGTVTIGFGYTTLTIQLSGVGSGAVLSYQATIGSTVTPLSAGSTLTLPSANVGSTSSAKVQISNTGDLTTQVSSITFTGAGFSSPDEPPTPISLAPGTSSSFTVVFTPKSPGAASATLFMDGFAVALTATGVGAQFTFASQTTSGTTPVSDGGTIIFPNTSLGSRSSLTMIVTNTGNAAGTINGISASGLGFSIPAPPALPAVVGAGNTLQFAITFAPPSIGTVTGSLQMDNTSITLRGVGNAPPTIGTVNFTGLSATVQPAQQPGVGLSLAQPYTVDLTGQLTLAETSSSFQSDPNVQFATGGTTVSFRIPANSLQAVFGTGNSAQVAFQAGTVAGTISVAASFAVNGVDITPSPAPSTTITVPSLAPQLTNLALGTITATSFELLITGYSTPRTLSQFNLQFTPAANSNLQTTTLPVNVAAAFNSWYQSATGVGYGSQFTASVIINVSGPFSAVSSVSVSAQNPVGTSNTTNVTLQ